MLCALCALCALCDTKTTCDPTLRSTVQGVVPRANGPASCPTPKPAAEKGNIPFPKGKIEPPKGENRGPRVVVFKVRYAHVELDRNSIHTGGGVGAPVAWGGAEACARAVRVLVWGFPPVA